MRGLQGFSDAGIPRHAKETLQALFLRFLFLCRDRLRARSGCTASTSSVRSAATQEMLRQAEKVQGAGSWICAADRW